MVKINGKKISGLQFAAKDWHAVGDYPGFTVEILFNTLTGEVWSKLMTQNSWTVTVPGEDVVKFDLGAASGLPYRQKLAWLRQAVADALNQR